MSRDLRPDSSYTLPDSLRPALAEPWGPVVDTPTLGAMLRPDDLVLAVGDVVSATLLDLGIQPRVMVVDHQTRRGGHDPALAARFEGVGHEVRVHNPVATVGREAWDAIAAAVRHEGTTRIKVEGEEDLLGIPCFLEAPDDAIVVYGMPGKGAVVCRVTPQLREKVAALLAGFTRR